MTPLNYGEDVHNDDIFKDALSPIQNDEVPLPQQDTEMKVFESPDKELQS